MLILIEISQAIKCITHVAEPKKLRDVKNDGNGEISGGALDAPHLLPTALYADLQNLNFFTQKSRDQNKIYFA